MLRTAIFGLLGSLAVAWAAPALAAGEAVTPPAQDWPHSGLFGTIDRASAQRGFQVYKEVCSACHSMNLLAYRNLAALGFNEDQIKAIAAQYEVPAAPNENGEVLPRPAIPADRFKAPFPNEQAARAANNGALPPDLSVIAKARSHGEDYLYAMLTGYHDPPPGFELQPGMNYNEYFPGHQIAMPNVLFDDGITYTDGTPATARQMARDVATFLTWSAEPAMEERKQTGVKVMLFLLVLAGMLYAVKRKVWADVH